MENIVLASSSTTRQKILKAAGVAFEIKTAQVDEREIKTALLEGGAEPPFIAEALAEHKSCAVSRHLSERLVLGADQVLECENKFYSKPETLDNAREQLLSLRGKEHCLTSSVVVSQNGERVWHYNETALLQMRSFSDRFLDSYILKERDRLLDGPGCYRVEGLGIQLFSRIEGNFFTILGLPLLPLLDYLRLCGGIAE